MYRSSPFRSTLNTSYITGLDMCKVCTEAVHSVALCREKNAQTPKRGNGKEDRNRARGVFQVRRTSRSVGIYNIYIYISMYRELKRNFRTFTPQKPSSSACFLSNDSMLAKYLNFGPTCPTKEPSLPARR